MALHSTWSGSPGGGSASGTGWLPATSAPPPSDERKPVAAHENGPAEKDQHDPAESELEVTTCPEHGEQAVVGYESTGGPDPYGVDKLACGDRVMCFGPGEPNVIIG